MRSSEQTEKLDNALAKAQAEMKNPTKSKTAKIPGKDGKAGFEYSYADLGEVASGVRPVLGKHGVAVIQGTLLVSGSVVLVTRLAHEGQWYESDYPVCQSGVPHQQMGSALTYARRYSLCAMVGVAADDDTDAQDAAIADAPQETLRKETAGARAEPPKSSAQAKKDGDWQRFTAEIKESRTIDELKYWARANAAAIKALPRKWFDEIQIIYEDRKTELQMLADDADPNRAMDREYAETVG